MLMRKKFSAVLLQEKPDVMGMVKKVHAYIAYGEIDKPTLKELLLRRGRHPGDKLVNADEIDDNFINNLMMGKAKLKDKDIKPFFRLHSPRHGFKKSTLTLYPKGTLGNHGEKINELLKRML